LDRFGRAPAQQWLRIAFFAAAAIAFAMAVIPTPDLVPIDSDKLQHMLAFFTLGMLGAGGFRRRSFLAVLLWLAAFGALIEIVQEIPALNRDSDVMDWLADLAASFVALTIARAIWPRLE
jgi:VanZ family protein